MATITRSRRARRGGSLVASAASLPRPVTPIAVVSTAVAGSTIAYTFNQPVSLDGVPQYVTDAPGAAPVSAARTSPTVVTVTYASAVTGATTVTVPFEDPAVRNSSGGFVNAGQLVL